MIDLKEIPSEGEIWEKFSEEFLNLQGLVTETPPDRGADGGKDLLMIESMSGPLHSSSFRWLVSCKHYAHSGKSVNETDHERNILERVKAFKADGFIGFYSTIPSAGLNTRLAALRDNREIVAYKIFNDQQIQTEMLSLGKSWLMRKYFPLSHQKTRPAHILFDKYIELNCIACGKDLIEDLYSGGKGAIIGVETSRSNHHHFESVYCACKGECDKTTERQIFLATGNSTSWADLSDVVMPNGYLRYIMATINQLRSGYTYSDEAFAMEKKIIMAISQRILREVTKEERRRLKEIMQYDIL